MRLIIWSFLVLTSLEIICQEKQVKGYLDLTNLDIEEVEDVTPIVVEALEKCKEEGYLGIKFPEGVYHFYPTYAPDFYTAITNNDNGLKRTPFPIFDFDNFHIDGGGAEFIFHGKMLPFIIEKSSKIKISNLSIDWEVPFFMQGTIIANDQEANTVDMSIETPFKVDGGELYLTIERADTPYERNFGNRFAKAEMYHQRLSNKIIWDRSTGAPIYNNSKYERFMNNLSDASIVKGNVVRYSYQAPDVPPIGSVLITKGEKLFNRECPGFRIFKSRDVLLENINVHHAGAMGLIAERSINITLDGFNVVLKEGTERVVTTTADATHFCNCRGLITIRNCTFENMLDDATNIHGTYARVNKILGDNQIAYETYHPQQMDYLFGEKGDSVQIVDQKTLLSKSEGLVIEDIKRVNEKISILTFNRPIRELVSVGDGIDNISWHASAIVENNVVRNNRARGFLISSSRKVIVRNNYISSQMAGMRITGDLKLWNESGPCDSLIIENNQFVNNAHGGGKYAIITIDPEQDLTDFEGSNYYSKDIIIRNNEFQAFDASVLSALSVDGLIFQNNKVIQTDAYKPLRPGEPNLKIMKCRNVKVDNNTYRLLSGKQAELTTVIEK